MKDQVNDDEFDIESHTHKNYFDHWHMFGREACGIEAIFERQPWPTLLRVVIMLMQAASDNIRVNCIAPGIIKTKFAEVSLDRTDHYCLLMVFFPT